MAGVANPGRRRYHARRRGHPRTTGRPAWWGLTDGMFSCRAFERLGTGCDPSRSGRLSPRRRQSDRIAPVSGGSACHGHCRARSQSRPHSAGVFTGHFQAQHNLAQNNGATPVQITPAIVGMERNACRAPFLCPSKANLRPLPCGVWSLARPGSTTATPSSREVDRSKCAPSIALTGFHALDGARYLRSVEDDERVTNLVAHHSCAAVEAELRDLSGALADFGQEDGLVADCLIFCDMTTRPDGGLVDIEGRLSEILRRYGWASLVGRFVEAASPRLRDEANRVEVMLSRAAV
jgi:hypothetical protein